MSGHANSQVIRKLESQPEHITKSVHISYVCPKSNNRSQNALWTYPPTSKYQPPSTYLIETRPSSVTVGSLTHLGSVGSEGDRPRCHFFTHIFGTLEGQISVIKDKEGSRCARDQKDFRAFQSEDERFGFYFGVQYHLDSSERKSEFRVASQNPELAYLEHGHWDSRMEGMHEMDVCIGDGNHGDYGKYGERGVSFVRVLQ
eukprot:493694-Amorphochlora_amoeboformis.AAC.1